MLSNQTARRFNIFADELLRDLARCVVRVSYLYVQKGLPKPTSMKDVPLRSNYFTSFFATINGEKVLNCTAGHNIANLASLSEQHEILKFEFRNTSETDIFVDVQPGDVKFAFAKQSAIGFDFGAIHTSQIAPQEMGVELEDMSEVAPAVVLNWIPDMYYAIGLPVDHAHTTLIAENDVAQIVSKNAVVGLPMELVTGKSTEQVPRFRCKRITPIAYSQSDGPVPFDVNGFSGGPVWAIKFFDDWYLKRLFGIVLQNDMESDIVDCGYLNNSIGALLEEKLSSSHVDISQIDSKTLSFHR